MTPEDFERELEAAIKRAIAARIPAPHIIAVILDVLNRALASWPDKQKADFAVELIKTTLPAAVARTRKSITGSKTPSTTRLQ